MSVSDNSVETYQIGDDRHRRFVARLRGLPETMGWQEIDDARDEEQRQQVIATRGLPTDTSWAEIAAIETRDYQYRRAGQTALLEKQRIELAIGCGLDETASWDKIGKSFKNPILAEKLQVLRLKKLWELSEEVQFLKELVRLPDPRTPGPKLTPD